MMHLDIFLKTNVRMNVKSDEVNDDVKLDKVNDDVKPCVRPIVIKRRMMLN